MTNRTVQIIGYGFGATPASVTATFNGTQVFSGNVPTVDISTTTDPAIQNNNTVLFTFEIPMDFAGNIPMSVTVENSPVSFSQIQANYCNVANVPPAGNTITYESSGPTGFFCTGRPKAINSDFILDARSNVIIDGTDVTPSVTTRESLSKFGAWGYAVDPNSTMSCDVEVVAGLE